MSKLKRLFRSNDSGPKLKSAFSLSRKHLLIYALIFAAVGAAILIFTFAATPQTKVWDTDTDFNTNSTKTNVTVAGGSVKLTGSGGSSTTDAKLDILTRFDSNYDSDFGGAWGCCQWGGMGENPPTPPANQAFSLVTSPKRLGTSAFKTRVESGWQAGGSTGDRTSAENHQWPGAPYFDAEEGYEFWYGLSVYFPPGQVWSNYVFQEWHAGQAPVNGQAPWHMNAANCNGTTCNIELSLNMGRVDVCGDGVFDLAVNKGWEVHGYYKNFLTVKEGEWNDIIFFVRWRDAANGRIMMYHKTEAQTDFRQVLDSNTSPFEDHRCWQTPVNKVWSTGIPTRVWWPGGTTNAQEWHYPLIGTYRVGNGPNGTTVNAQPSETYFDHYVRASATDPKSPDPNPGVNSGGFKLIAKEFGANVASAGPGTTYPSTGNIILPFDAGSTADWGSTLPEVSNPVGTNITYQYSSSTDNLTWSAWTPDINAVPNARYFRTQANLTTNDPSKTPSLDKLTLSYTYPPITKVWDSQAEFNATGNNISAATVTTDGKVELVKSGGGGVFQPDGVHIFMTDAEAAQMKKNINDPNKPEVKRAYDNMKARADGCAGPGPPPSTTPGRTIYDQYSLPAGHCVKSKAIAYKYTGNIAYAQQVAQIVEAWTALNPLSVNWGGPTLDMPMAMMVYAYDLTREAFTPAQVAKVKTWGQQWLAYGKGGMSGAVNSPWVDYAPWGDGGGWPMMEAYLGARIAEDQAGIDYVVKSNPINVDLATIAALAFPKETPGFHPYHLQCGPYGYGSENLPEIDPDVNGQPYTLKTALIGMISREGEMDGDCRHSIWYASHHLMPLVIMAQGEQHRHDTSVWGPSGDPYQYTNVPGGQPKLKLAYEWMGRFLSHQIPYPWRAGYNLDQYTNDFIQHANRTGVNPNLEGVGSPTFVSHQQGHFYDIYSRFEDGYNHYPSSVALRETLNATTLEGFAPVTNLNGKPLVRRGDRFGNHFFDYAAVTGDMGPVSASEGGTSTASTYTSPGSITLSHDAGAVSDWTSVDAIATKPSGTDITYQYRSSTDKTNASLWSPFTSDINSVPDGRYLEIKATLSTTNNTVTPSLDKITLVYEPLTPPTQPSATSPTHDAQVSNTAFFGISGSQSNSKDITVADKPDRMLIFGLTREFRTGCTNLDSVTYNGKPLTKLSTAGDTNSVRLEVWYLLNPDVGTHTLSANFASGATSSCNTRWGASTYYGVKQAAPTNIYNSALQVSTITSATNALADTKANSLVVDILGGSGSSLTSLNSDTGQSQSFSATDRPGSGQGYGNITSSYKTSSGGAVTTKQTTAAGSFSAWAYLQVELEAVAVEPPPPPPADFSITNTNIRDGATVPAGTTWSVSFDNLPDKVEFWADGAKIAEDIAAPFEQALNLSTGAHAINVCAWSGAARDCDMPSPGSAWAHITVTSPADTQAPTTPSGLVASAGSSSVNLTWTASTDNIGVIGYKIYRGAGTANLTLLDTLLGAATSYTDSGVSAGNSYTYKITAIDDSGNESAQSSAANASIADTVAPTTPTNLKASATSPASVNLTWTAATDNVGVTGHKVYRADLPACAKPGANPACAIPTVLPSTPLASLGNATNYTDNAATAEKDYVYYVTASDAAGNTSAPSAPATVTTPKVPDTISPTVAITAPAANSTVQGTSVNLSANVTDNIAVRDIQFYLDYGGDPNTNKLCALLTPSGTNLTNVDVSCSWDTTTLANGNHTLTAIATDTSNNPKTAASITVNVSNPVPPKPDTTAPNTPTNPATTGITHDSITFFWLSAEDLVKSGEITSGVASYNVYRNNTLLTNTTTLAIVDAGLTPDTNYSYQVTSLDNAGNESARSEAATAHTLAQPQPPQPQPEPEQPQQPAQPSNPNKARGDLNGDNKVTVTDLSILLSNYGKRTQTADLNNDTIVNVTDLSILLSNYGR